MSHQPRLALSLALAVCWSLSISLAPAQVSDEEGLKLRRERMPKKNTVQTVIAIPTKVVKLPFFLFGTGIKRTGIFIENSHLIPRAKNILTSDDGLVALYPTLGLGGRSGLEGELNFFNKRFLAEGNKLSLQVSYSTNAHQDHSIGYQIPGLIGPLSLALSGGYQVNANEDFFGIGSESLRDDRTNFRHAQLGGKLSVGADWASWFRTHLQVDYTDHAIGEGDGTYNSTVNDFNLQTAPGLEGATLLGFGGSIALDTRDNSFHPAKGGLAQFSVMAFDQTDADEFEFIRYSLTLAHYLKLFSPRRILAARLYGEIISDAKDTPFFARASLGGDTTLRGYSTGRFRDKDLILLNLEYRYAIWDKELKGYGALDAVLFMDIGRVFNDLSQDTFKDYEISYGAGLRARTKSGFLFRAEVADSSEETNLILKFEPIF